MEDIVHDCSYFENDADFYWEPVKLFEGRSDMRPTTKAENERIYATLTVCCKMYS